MSYPGMLKANLGSRYDDEQALLAGLRTGEQAAFEALVRMYTPRLLSVAQRFLRNEEDARDALQDAFLAAFRSLDRFEAESKLSTWLHRIVVNACLMKLRTRRRKPEESIEPAILWKRPAQAEVESNETRRMVRRCIECLPETHRTVLLLRDIEGYDTESAAEMLGITANAVKVRLHRARQGLRSLLDPYFRGDAQ
jgi:RNA polymerase sigma-70 factor (ECF subfamily)